MIVGGKMAYLEPKKSNIQLACHWEVILKICKITCSLAMMLTFGGPLSAVHLVYTFEIAVGHRRKHVEDFSPNGQFVHFLKVFENIDQYVMYVLPFKVENSLIQGTVCLYMYLANFGCPLSVVHLLYNLRIARPNKMGRAEHFGANGQFVHLLEVY